MKQNDSNHFRVIWTAPFVAILLAHFLMDSMSGMIPASLGLLQERWGLSDRSGAIFLGMGSLCSGVAQPFFAWLSDRTGSRAFGGIGLAMAAALISSIGLATGSWQLFAFYAFGMVGNGMFHPVGASTIGQLNPIRRSLAVSLFFVAGMLGGVMGAALGPRLLVLENGFQLLRWFVVPCVAVAVFLHLKIRGIEHRSVTSRDAVPVPQNARALGAVVLLYISAAIRFMVNLALIYLYVRWTEQMVAGQFPDLTSGQVSKQAAPLIGNINAFSIGGMAFGGLLSGAFIRGGQEKWPLVIVPILFAPCVAFFPVLSSAGTWAAWLLAFLAGVGFATLVPVTIALAQRLMPGRTSLASGLMMGGAWTVAMFGPTLADIVIASYGVEVAFFSSGAIMFVSGLFVLPIQSATIRGSVASDLASRQ